MGTHMKTTVEISDPLLAEAKRVAREDRTTLRALIEEGLRRVLDEHERPPATPFKLKDASWGGELQPGIDPSNWGQMHALIYGDDRE